MLTHKGTQTITTSRLVLRQFALSDAQAMFDNWASDEKVAHYVTWPAHTSPDVTKSLLTQWCLCYADEKYYNWVITLSGQPIGNISVVRQNEKSRWCELGYCLGSAYRNQGIMTEAVQAVIDYLFDVVGFHRIVIEHAANNPASGKVAQKCGFKMEGVARESYQNAAGEFGDIVSYAILQTDRRE